MLKGRVKDCCGVPLSVTVTLNVPLAVGVPVIAQVAELRLKPAGKLPAVIENVYGVTPPVALQLDE